VLAAALDPASPVDPRATLAHLEGGRVPTGKVFVVDTLEYSAEPIRDGARARMRIVCGDREIVALTSAELPARGRWTGSLPLASGDAARTFVEVQEVARCSVIAYGTWSDAPQGR
jgi:hypothetical protein